MVDWEFFRIGDQYYLAAAVAVTSSSVTSSLTSSGRSTVYRLDKVRKQFDVYQHITTHRSVARWRHMHTTDLIQYISQLPKLCVKISILMHKRMWVRSFSTRLTSVTFAEDKVLIFLIFRKNAKIVQL